MAERRGPAMFRINPLSDKQPRVADGHGGKDLADLFRRSAVG